MDPLWKKYILHQILEIIGHAPLNLNCRDRSVSRCREKAFKNPKIEFMWDSVVEEVGGDDILQWMKVKNVKTGEVTTVEAVAQ